MKKYSADWKKAQINGWMQKHADGKIYHHYIRNDTEYRTLTSHSTMREAKNAMELDRQLGK
jgi:hypothetical protein